MSSPVRFSSFAVAICFVIGCSAPSLAQHCGVTAYSPVVGVQTAAQPVVTYIPQRRGLFGRRIVYQPVFMYSPSSAAVVGVPATQGAIVRGNTAYYGVNDQAVVGVGVQPHAALRYPGVVNDVVPHVVASPGAQVVELPAQANAVIATPANPAPIPTRSVFQTPVNRTNFFRPLATSPFQVPY